MKSLARRLAALLIVGAFTACGSSSSTPTPSSDRTVTLSWAQNRESGVNKAGGGYRVTIAGRPTILVPWVSGTTAPTSTVVQLPSGTYTATVVAYAALDAQGGATGSVSEPSQPLTIQVP